MEGGQGKRRSTCRSAVRHNMIRASVVILVSLFNVLQRDSSPFAIRVSTICSRAMHLY